MSIGHPRPRHPGRPRVRRAAIDRAAARWRQLFVVSALSLAGALAATALLSARVDAQDWVISEVDQGTKPALGVTPDGDPVVIYMLERIEGWTRIASLVDGEWVVDEIATGYFYGPPDLTVDDDGIAHAAYHDHQASSFQPSLGDAVYATGSVGDWSVSTAEDAGHDGWDNRVTVDSDGRPHMVAVDPLEFEGSGVEYYALGDDGTWTVEQIGSGPQTYKYAISVAVDGGGTPWITYHDGSTGTLELAHRTADGWAIETVDDRGRTGLFSELRIDARGGQHVSYLEQTGDTTGTVRYAFRPDTSSGWELSDVDSLDAFFFGFTGARNITSIDLDSSQNPWILYSDEAVMKLARPGDGTWEHEVVSEATDAPFGQIVSLAIDAADAPHVAYATVSSKSPLDGTVLYARRAQR